MTLIDKIMGNRTSWENRTPCFVLDRMIIEDKLREFEDNFDGEIAYSLKTNPHQEIIRLIHNRGNNFMVCSIEELQQLQQMIEDVSRVIYLSPTLNEEELKEVSQLSVKRLSLDSPSQVEMVVSHAQNLEEVFLRVSTSHKIQQENFLYKKNSYLGIPIDEALAYLETLSQNKIRLGIHNHLCSQNTDLQSWRENLDVLNEFIKSAKQKSLSLNSINLGGGFPISYNGDVPRLEEIAEIVSKYQSKIRDFYPNICFVFEPGRYIVGESTVLITRVNQKKRFYHRDILIVDASTYNSFMDTILVGLDLSCQVLPNEENSSRPKEHYIIRGRSPCSLDIFRKDAILPKTEVNDYVVFLNVGAYNFASDFVSLKKPEIILI
ncbi:alanine racemase [Candidatus Woesearchaeota archaeon]|nr:alanine racemase [Candidatus Woesearchaeota archaeon]